MRALFSIAILCCVGCAHERPVPLYNYNTLAHFYGIDCHAMWASGQYTLCINAQRQIAALLPQQRPALEAAVQRVRAENKTYTDLNRALLPPEYRP
jgi:hypothetical protein